MPTMQKFCCPSIYQYLKLLILFLSYYIYNMLLIGNNDSVDNPTLITPWFIIHVFNSCFSYTLLNNYFFNNWTSAYIVIFLHTLYELKDYYYSYYNIEFEGRCSNSILNSIGDTIACFIGIYLRWQLNLPSNIIYIISTILYIIFKRSSLD